MVKNKMFGHLEAVHDRPHLLPDLGLTERCSGPSGNAPFKSVQSLLRRLKKVVSLSFPFLSKEGIETSDEPLSRIFVGSNLR